MINIYNLLYLYFNYHQFFFNHSNIFVAPRDHMVAEFYLILNVFRVIVVFISSKMSALNLLLSLCVEEEES